MPGTSFIHMHMPANYKKIKGNGNMSHPLEIKLADLTDDELNDRITELYGRMKFFGPGGNSGLINQIHLFLDEAINEQIMRSERQMGGYDKNKDKT